jgi:hypothetical protein
VTILLPEIVSPATGAPLPAAIVSNGQTCPIGTMCRVPTLGVAPTVKLPDVSTAAASVIGVADTDEHASEHPITIDGNGKTIDGEATLVVSDSGAVVVLLWEREVGEWRRSLVPRRLRSCGELVRLTRDLPPAGVEIEDEGIDEGRVGILNFTGDISATVVGNRATVDVTFPAEGVDIESAGVPQGRAETIDFTGDMTASVAAGVATVSVTVPPVVFPLAYEGVSQGDVGSLDVYGDGARASASLGVGQLVVTGSPIMLLAGGFNTPQSTFQRIAAREIDISSLPLALVDGLALVARLHVTLESSTAAATAEARLFDTTEGATVTSTVLSNGAVSDKTIPTELVSDAIPIGGSPGDLSPAGARMLEVHLRMTAGGQFDVAIVRGARLVLSYE